MNKIVLTSYTSIDSPGGVPRWCRDFVGAFPKGRVEHYSWSDVVKMLGHDENIPEWDKASSLILWLVTLGKLKKNDVLIGDGFWADAGQLHDPKMTLQVAHGNWSHTTFDDVRKGIPPEFPEHHAAQLSFRKRFARAGGKTVAVSDFISDQCKLQWGFEYDVINNGVDLKKFYPVEEKIPRNRPVIVHGVTNANKGFEHVEILKKNLDADVILLDEAEKHFVLPKYRALSQADLVVVPSNHEGNSYFVLESLASGVPIVGYNVGLLYKAVLDGHSSLIGNILARENRSPEFTLAGVSYELESKDKRDPRKFSLEYSLENFRYNWRDYMKMNFGVEC